MSKNKTESSGLDIEGLLSLKSFEHPDADRIEKNVQSTMQAVRAAHKQPSLHLFPDKSAAWMFAQPRYGIAALFILFLGLHLMQRPMPVETIGSTAVNEPELAVELSAVTASNDMPVVASPPLPGVRQQNYSSLIRPVSFSD